MAPVGTEREGDGRGSRPLIVRSANKTDDRGAINDNVAILVSPAHTIASSTCLAQRQSSSLFAPRTERHTNSAKAEMHRRDAGRQDSSGTTAGGRVSIHRRWPAPAGQETTKEATMH